MSIRTARSGTEFIYYRTIWACRRTHPTYLPLRSCCSSKTLFLVELERNEAALLIHAASPNGWGNRHIIFITYKSIKLLIHIKSQSINRYDELESASVWGSYKILYQTWTRYTHIYKNSLPNIQIPHSKLIYVHHITANEHGRHVGLSSRLHQRASETVQGTSYLHSLRIKRGLLETSFIHVLFLFADVER